METIIYKSNQIRKWNDGTYTAYIMDRYGDITEYETNSLEEAKSFIDKNTKGSEYETYKM